MAGLLELDDALVIIGKTIRAVTELESCSLPQALGRITAKDITAPYALPPFTNTGVDGYAFRHKEAKTTYKLAGASYAGEPFTGVVADGEMVRIATGAVLPEGADTVAMQEICAVEGDKVVLTEFPAKGSNIRHAGADIAAGAIVLPAGYRLRPQDIAVLGALGLTDISVLRRLRIGIASTGHELLMPGTKLQPGQIIDTNSLMLAQMLSTLAVDVEILNSLPDDYAQTQDSLMAAAKRLDLIITTGGVSVGDRDFVRDVMHDHGTIHFWKLALRPGKPVIYGEIGGCAMIGLPGNPVSAFVTFFMVVRPALNALCGQGAFLPPAYGVTLANDHAKPSHLRCFPRARLQGGKAVPYHDQSSNLFTSLTDADGILDLPTGEAAYKAGDVVLFRPFSGLL